MKQLIRIPEEFLKVKYNGKAYPGNANDFQDGANCQHYCYEFLRYYGYEIENLRSSNLWEDSQFTVQVEDLKPFDIVLVHDSKNSFGAHVGVCIGNDEILHLSFENNYPKIERLPELMNNKKYKYLIGIKRPILKKPTR